MSENTILDEKPMIDEALRAMQSREPNIPRANIKKCLSLIGEEIKQSGGLSREYVDTLLNKLRIREI